MSKELEDQAAAESAAQTEVDHSQVDHQQPPEERASEAAAFLDTLTAEEGDTNVNNEEGHDVSPLRDEHGRFAPKPADGTKAADDPSAAVDPKAAKPATEEKKGPSKDEDAELLEGIKSERGRERVQRLIAERNEVRAKAEQLDRSMAEVRTVLEGAGMDAAQFAQHIEFSRLANSNDPQSLQLAAQMIEQVRVDIYKRLGQDAPGVDVLADFPDLAQRVNAFELDRQAALELAQYRRQQQQAQQTQQQQRQAEQEQQQQTQALQSSLAQVELYLNTRAHEVDHQPRMEVLSKYFKDPNNIQEFVRTYRPEQMSQAIRWMYDNIQVAPRNPSPSPIRARPQAVGSPIGRPGDEPVQKLSSILDSMGI